MHTILLIILYIFLISAAVAMIAFFSDQLTKKETTHKPYGPYERFFKRPLDAFLATGAIIILSPIILVTAFLVMIKLGIPILFIQKRPGLNTRLFSLYKFRTMLPPNEGIIDPAQDALRLTPFGKALRATSLDELPELINIIKGDMAVVGPRPLLVQYLARYNSHQARRHEVRPGFTGLAQVHGRNAISWETKFNWDIEYVNKITFLGDCRIVLATIKTVFKREGINAEGEATIPEFMGSNK